MDSLRTPNHMYTYVSPSRRIICLCLNHIVQDALEFTKLNPVYVVPLKYKSVQTHRVLCTYVHSQIHPTLPFTSCSCMGVPAVFKVITVSHEKMAFSNQDI